MDYIRRQRSVTDSYDPNTRHVLYGLDADLIMLALATHEPYFKILREDVFFNQNNNKGCFICGQSDHQAAECTGLLISFNLFYHIMYVITKIGKKKEKVGVYDEKGQIVQRPYVFLHVSILREYLEVELKEQNLSFGWDLERAIDDWIFLCFFVGNDFLPHLPSLEIREGAIDKLIDIWKRKLPEFGGYITNNGDIDLYRVQILLSELGTLEDEIFVKRRQEEERKRNNRRRRKEEAAQLKKQREKDHERHYNDPQFIADAYAQVPSFTPKEMQDYNEKTIHDKKRAKLDANKAAAAFLKKSLMHDTISATSSSVESAVVITTEDQVDKSSSDIVIAESNEIDEVIVKEDDIKDEVVEGVEDDEEEEIIVESMTVADVPITIKKAVDDSSADKKETVEDDDDKEPEDNVRLWESGWKKRYYDKKFHEDDSNREFVKK